MTAAQVAINDRILREYAARVEAIGYQGDACRFVEGLLLGAIGDGWKPLEPPPPPRGPGAAREAIDQALTAAAQAVRDAKIKGGRL